MKNTLDMQLEMESRNSFQPIDDDDDEERLIEMRQPEQYESYDDDLELKSDSEDEDTPGGLMI